LEIGFVQSSADPCVFIRKNKSLAIMTVYVDDLVLITKDKKVLNELKQSLSSRFKMSDMGPLHYILGISVVQSPSNLWLSQSTYIEKMLEKFGLADAKPVSTPLDVNVTLVKDDGVSKPVDIKQYQSIVGSLLYLAIASRPDIQHAVSTVAKYNSKPSEAHLTAAKRILRYLSGTKTFGLCYQASPEKLFGFADADFAGDVSDRHSTSGYCFLLASGLISWYSKKQTVIARSTANAEYISLSLAAQEAVWLKRLFSEIGVNFESIVVKDDSQAAIAMSKNPVHHAKSKHIEVHYHFIREEVERGTITLEYCSTSDMVADLLTKALPKVQFQKLRALMGVCNMQP